MEKITISNPDSDSSVTGGLNYGLAGRLTAFAGTVFGGTGYGIRALRAGLEVLKDKFSSNKDGGNFSS